MTQGRLHGRIQRMGRQSPTDTTAAAEPSSSGAPGRRGRAGTGASSPGGTPATAPGLQSAGLISVTDAASEASGVMSSPNGGGAASPPGPQTMPMQAVIVGPAVGDYVTLGAQQLHPLITADGAAIPATAPGRWGQVVAAGRP